MWFWNRFEILGILLKIFIFIGAFCFFDKVFFLCKFRQKEYFWNFSYLYFKLLQNYNQCVNIPKTVSEISTMGESIQIKKVHSVYITLWTLHLRKEGDSNPRYSNPVRQFSKLLVSATHPSFQRTICRWHHFFKCSAKISGIFETANFFALFYFGNNRYFCPVKVLLRCV